MSSIRMDNQASLWTQDTGNGAADKEAKLAPEEDRSQEVKNRLTHTKLPRYAKLDFDPT